MTDEWFEGFEPATPADAAFLRGFRSASRSLPALGLSAADVTAYTWNTSALVIEVVVAGATESVRPAQIHILFRAGDPNLLIADWAFDEYVLDDAHDLMSDGTLDAHSAGERAGGWLEAQLGRELYRDEWDGRRPISAYRLEGESVARYRFRAPDRTVRVR
jgi:hypothetical protein